MVSIVLSFKENIARLCANLPGAPTVVEIGRYLVIGAVVVPNGLLAVVGQVLKIPIGTGQREAADIVLLTCNRKVNVRGVARTGKIGNGDGQVSGVKGEGIGAKHMDT